MGCGSSKSTTVTEQARVVMLGLDKTGKTQILYVLKLGQEIQTLPTVGFNMEVLPVFRNYQFTVIDHGGDSRMRHLWKKHYEHCRGIIFVVDSTDTQRLAEAKEVLFGVLSDRNLRGVPLLVLANKTDLPGALDRSQIQESLHLKAIIDRVWALNAVCAIRNEGLDVSMGDLARMISESRKTREDLKNNKKVNGTMV